MLVGKDRADEVRVKADIGQRMSAAGGQADVPVTWSDSLLVAKSRLIAGHIISDRRQNQPDPAVWVSIVKKAIESISRPVLAGLDLKAK